MVYTCLHAMRVGLLTRFWGSLGMALGAVSFIFFSLVLLWFIYLALLLLGLGSPVGARLRGQPAKRSPGPRRARKPPPTSHRRLRIRKSPRTLRFRRLSARPSASSATS